MFSAHFHIVRSNLRSSDDGPWPALKNSLKLQCIFILENDPDLIESRSDPNGRGGDFMDLDRKAGRSFFALHLRELLLITNHY
jgi:hypothetical protein